MTARTIKRRLCLGSPLAWIISDVPLAAAAPSSGIELDWSAPPGANYDRASFRVWCPDGARLLRAVVVLVPGSNEDGRPQVEDSEWQAFATKHGLALVGCCLTDKSHPQMFVEQYVNASRGSGQALLDAIENFGAHLGRSELAHAPLLLWGMSAGGQFNYEFVAWKPDRVVGFIVNKGGIYYSALLSQGAREVPGLLFIGDEDLEIRKDAIRGIFAINRRAGALWALIEEPMTGHVVGRSRKIAEMFFEDLIALRLGHLSALEPTDLRSLIEEDGYWGDPESRTAQRIVSKQNRDASAYATSWLPTERIARLWEAASKGQRLPK